MPKSSLTVAPQTIDIAPHPSEAWTKARRYVELTSLHLAASCAAQVMTGFELLTLHKFYGVRQGKRHDLGANFFHDERSWAAAVKAELGVSETTAWRWMEMAKVARKRLEKDGTDLAALLAQPPSALTEGEREALKRAVHKITDGQTQSELMLEWGITKKPQGSGATGGARQSSADDADGEPAAPDDGWHPIAKQLNTLLLEHLDEANQYWFQCSEAKRRELLGNLRDAATRIAATLKEPRK